MSGGQQQGGGGIVLRSVVSGKGMHVAKADLQEIANALSDGALKTMIQNYLASLTDDD